MHLTIPKVSVVMSVYNGSRYLKESVDSILNQTLAELEFIIIDDCSTDNTWDVLSRYAQQDQRIKLIRNEENLGLTRSLNKGLKLVKGEYIARQDADDISLPERLSIQTQFLDSHPDVGVLGTDADKINEHNALISSHAPTDGNEMLTEHETLRAFLLLNNCLYHSSLMARSKLITQIGGYDESLPYAQDYDVWWRLSQLSHIATLPNRLIRLRCSASNITTKKRREQLECAYKISLNAISENLKSESFNEAAYQNFWWNTLRFLDKESYQNIWLKNHKGQALLHTSDIQQLEPFWQLLATFPGAAKVWGTPVQSLAFDLLDSYQTVAGLYLLWVVSHYLKVASPWKKVVKAVVRPYIRYLKTDFLKTLKLRKSGVVS